MSIDSYYKYLLDWTNTNSTNVLFDSENEELTSRTIYSKINGKNHICFIVTDENNNIFGSYHTVIPIANKFIGEKDDQFHFIFTLCNPHNIPPTRYFPSKTNDDILKIFNSDDIRNVVDIKGAYGIVSNNKVFIYESIISRYVDIPPKGPLLLIGNANVFVNMKRFVVLEMK
ncbi:TLDc domain-containing protein [Entamoeba marina]